MELQILESLQKIHFNFLDNLMTFITNLGNGGIIWIAIIIILLFQKNNKFKREGFTIAIALIIFSIIGLLILKPIIRRPRPFNFYNVDLLIGEPFGFSFPSGHTGSSFSAATVINFHNKKAGFFAIVLASLIAFSRMYHFVHYPTDVLAGILIGIFSGTMAIKFTKILSQKIIKN